MSLTNDMLKNLENHPKARPTQDELLEGLEAAASNKWYYLIYFVGVIFLITIFSGFIYFLFHKQMGAHSSAVPKSFVLKPESVPLRKIPAAAAAPALAVPAPPKDLSSLPPYPGPVVAAPTPKNIEDGPSDALVKVPVKESIEVKVSDQYQAALADLGNGQTTQAIQKLESLLQVFPDYQLARKSLATLLLQTNQPHEAIDVLQKGLASDPNNLDFILLLARGLIAENHPNQALALLTPWQDKASGDMAFNDLFAALNRTLGDNKKAISIYQKLLTQDPSNARWLLGLAVSLKQDHQDENALKAFQAAKATGQISGSTATYVDDQIQHLS